MLHVPDALLEEGDDVFIFDAVEDFLALTAGHNQPHLAQPAQMMGDSRFADADNLGKAADIHLAFDQGGEQAHAAGIAEGAKQFSHVGSGVFVKSVFRS
jgi:hypothetical protein